MIRVGFKSTDFIDKLAVCEICCEINLLNLGSLLSLFTEMSNNYFWSVFKMKIVYFRPIR